MHSPRPGIGRPRHLWEVRQAYIAKQLPWSLMEQEIQSSFFPTEAKKKTKPFFFPFTAIARHPATSITLGLEIIATTLHICLIVAGGC
jgi:hypothetical protein